MSANFDQTENLSLGVPVLPSMIGGQALEGWRPIQSEKWRNLLQKDDKKKGSGSSAGIGGLLPGLSFGLAMVFAILTALAIFDFKFFDLRPVLHGLEPWFLSGLPDACVAGVFFRRTKFETQAFGLSETLAAFRAEIESLIAAQKSATEEAASANKTQSAAALKEITQKVDTFIGAEHGRLKEENDRLRTHLDSLLSRDAEKVASEMEALRQKNAELEQRITQWAVGSIDSRIERKTLQAA